MHRSDYSTFRQRLKALKVPMDRGELGSLLCRTQSTGDALLRRRLELKLDAAEAAHELCPFTEPDAVADLSSGDIHLVDTQGGQTVCVQCEPGCPTSFVHLATLGTSGTGKTSLLIQLATQAAASAHTFIVDSLRAFRRSPAMRRSHRFIRVSDLRLNLWDTPPGIASSVFDLTVNREVARNFGLQFALYEINEAVSELRRKGVPNIDAAIRTLERKRYDNFSRRSQYRDSAVLILGNLVAGTGELFRCQQGMSLDSLLTGNTVLEVDELLPEYVRFLTRFLFEFLHLRAHPENGKHMLFILDEGHPLIDEDDFYGKTQRLRHYNVHLAVGFQNPSLVPIEFLGNTDCSAAFATQDSRDRRVVAQALNLAPEQEAYLSTLGVGECLCFLPRSGHKQAFLAKVPRVEFSDVDESEIRRRSKALTDAFAWMPLEAGVEDEIVAGAGDLKRAKQRADHFLRDVLNQAHEFSSLMGRFERAGIRSAEMQGKILREWIAAGYVKVWTLAIGKGRPIKLVEPTQKALDEFHVEWKKGRGSLPTRAATEFLFRKLKRNQEWNWEREGKLGDKAVDLLGVDAAGAMTAVEIAGSGGPGHECHNALHCVRQGVRKHCVVCSDKKVLVEAKRLLARHDELVEAAKGGRLEVVLLSKALGEDWSP